MKLKSIFLGTLSAGLIVLLGGCTPIPLPTTPAPAQPEAGQPVVAVETASETPTPAAVSAPAETTADQDDPGFNILVEVKGEVLLQRQNWAGFYPTAFGVSLVRGDLLKLSNGAQARILCDNLNIWTVPSSAAPSGLNGCPRPAEPFLLRPGGRIINTRGGDPAVPYIISPRSTKLLNLTPTLRWNDTGAATYTVEIRGGDLEWSQEGITGAEMVYSGEPPLLPGVTYLLVVTDESGKSSQDEGARGLGFELLDEAAAQEIQAQVEHIGELNLSPEAENLALAQLYASYELMAEAIETLEALLEAGNQPASIHQTLADFYSRLGLALLAEERYLSALELATAEGNLEAETVIHASLGESIYPSLGNAGEAIRHLEAAQLGYETLGDAARAQEIAGLLEVLK
jgi:hypothetical protein